MPQGLPAMSLQWGAWAGSGMAASDVQLVAALARAGMGAVTPQQGLHVLSGVLDVGTWKGAHGPSIGCQCIGIDNPVAA